MTLAQARKKLNDCIEIMENESTSMSYAAILYLPKKEKYVVEYGTKEKKLGTYSKKYDGLISENYEKPTIQSSGRLLQKIKEHIRPIKAGTSISDELSVFKSGTLGILLSFNESNKTYGLTNMHIASSYRSQNESPNIKITKEHQNIYQPSSIDRVSLNYNKSYDKPIGKTVWKIFNKTLDAALIEIREKENCAEGLFNCELSNLNSYNYGNLKINSNSHKQGRTSGYTQGNILSTEAAIKIKNPFQKINKHGKYIVFRDQIMTENMAEPGDSGSILISNGQIIGLTFADINFQKSNSFGALLSEPNLKTDGRTFHNKIENILKAIEIKNKEGEKINPTFIKFFI